MLSIKSKTAPIFIGAVFFITTQKLICCWVIHFWLVTQIERKEYNKAKKKNTKKQKYKKQLEDVVLFAFFDINNKFRNIV